MKRKSLLIIVAVFIVAWLLGFMRFDSNVALAGFQILMFPFGYIFLLIEKYSATMHSGHYLQNEYIQGVMFVVAIMFQSILYVFLISLIWKRFSAK